jgi:hypothetical protein
MIGAAIGCFIFDLLLCGMIIYSLIQIIFILIYKYHQQHQKYYLRKPTKYNNSSRQIKNRWWLSKQYVHKLKMVMSGVSNQENHQFNV